MVLDTLDMPLVDEDNDLLALGLVDGLEDVLIALVNEDLLDLREEDVARSNVPVDKMLVKAFLGEGLRVSLMDFLAVRHQLLCVEALSVLNAFPQIVRRVHSGLMVDTINGLTVHL